MQIGNTESIAERSLYCDPKTGNEVAKPVNLAPGNAVDTITFGLRRSLTGRDDVAIANALFQEVGTGRRSRTAMCPGAARRARICRSVAWVKGDLVDAGGIPVTQMTEAIYDGLPAWMTARLYGWLGELDAEGAIDEGESSGQ